MPFSLRPSGQYCSSRSTQWSTAGSGSQQCRGAWVLATISAALLLLLAHNGFPWTSPTSTFAGRVRPTDGIDPFRSERLPGNIRAMVGDPREFVTPSLIRGRHYILRRTHFHLEGYISNGSADDTLAGHPHGGPTVRKPTSGSHVCTTGFALHEAGQRCPYSAWRPVNPSSTIRQKCSPTNMPPHSSQPLFLLRSGADTMQKWTGPAETQRPRHWFG